MKHTLSLLSQIATYVFAAIGIIAVRNWAIAKIEAWDARQEERYQKRIREIMKVDDE